MVNLLLLGLLAYSFSQRDPVVTRLRNSVGTTREVRASTVRRALVDRHSEDVLGDLAGREMVTLAAEESGLQLDAKELEERWQLWTSDPSVKASLDSGATTEKELRAKLVTLVLLDQLSLNEYNPKEREELLRRFYDRNKRELEQIQIRHILLSTEKEAREVADRLSAGVDFAQLATRFSLDPLTREQGGLLGWKSRDDLREELRPLLFLMPEGRASKPLATEHGWHLFLVEDRLVEFAELHKHVERQWCESRRAETLAQLRARFKLATPAKSELVDLLRPSGDPKELPESDRTQL